jgi:Na+/melibiose symporter-like transporter
MTSNGRRAINWTQEGLNAAGDVLATSLLVALKLGLVLLFVWYVVALIDVAPGLMGKVLVVGPMVAVLVIPTWTFFTAERTTNDGKATTSPRGRIGPYVLLVIVPIVIVGVLSAAYRKFHPGAWLFSTSLLHETEYALDVMWKQIWP